MDYYEVQQGRLRQEIAKSAFDRGEFEQAYHFYVEAEDFYRQGYDTIGDRVFFMQSSALRCLEEILDTRPDLFDAYQARAKAFLNEWSEVDICNNISHRRINEALSFWMWRESYFKGFHEFRSVSIAAEQREFKKAREILDAFINKMESSDYKESDALCAIARSKRAMVDVWEERQKPEDQRDIYSQARGYLLAARASRLPKNSTSQQRLRLEMFRRLFLSDALKFRAFDLLSKDKIHDPIILLTKAKQYLSRALAYAKEDSEMAGKGEFPSSHPLYLTYWYAVVSERLYLLRFMLKDDDADFELAMNNWQKALNAAKQLSKRGGEYAIFPNRFYSLKDLELEPIFLSAARAFKQREWQKCITLLETWRQDFPKEYCWSWRDMNVYIRLLGVKVIQGLIKGDQTETSSNCKKLMKVSLSEQVGSAARYYAEEVQRLPEKREQPTFFDSVLNSLSHYFPLDSYIDTYQRPSEIDPLASLPQRIYRGIRLLPPLNNTEVERFMSEFLGSFEALLGYICDYHAQRLSSSEAVPSPGIKSLIEGCRKFPWAKRKAAQDTLSKLETAINELYEVKETEMFTSSYEKIQGMLLRLLPFIPLLIDIRSDKPCKEEIKALAATPDWLIKRSGRQELFIFVSEGLSRIKVGQYYLPPDWRKGNRVSYWVSENHPLIQVRYEPRWDFWDKEREAIRLGITTLFRQCIANYLLSSGLSVKQEHVLGSGSPPIDIYWESEGESFVVETKFSFSGNLAHEGALAQLRRGMENARRFAPHLAHRIILVTNATSFAPNIKASFKSGEIEIWIASVKPTPKKILRNPGAMIVKGIKHISPTNSDNNA